MIPEEVVSVVKELEKHGFEAYVVGGCVRDLLLEKEPWDWDVATSATPEQIQSIFPDSFYENKFFTVTVKTGSSNPRLKEIEITTYRAEFEYADRRRPGKVEYAKNIEEDLSRRDFTINAVALGLKHEVVDPFHGQEDLKDKIIRAVGDADQRFQEDALRMMRAVRFFAALGFGVEQKTRAAIQKNSRLLKEISEERIRDEFSKIVMSGRPMEAIEELRELGLLQYIIPELEQGYGVTQNKHHIYTVWEHNLRSLQYAAEKNFSFEVRLASLLHDIGKPKTKGGEGPDATFYGHQVVGARMARKILERLHFSKEIIEKIVLLVREHMFVYDPDTVTLRGVRRLVARVGPEHMEELFQLREADRIGSGVPKAQPYRLRHLKAMVEKVKQDPISPKMLAINGNDAMQILQIEPGPKVGAILAVLLEEVLDDPKRNAKEYLENRTQELGKMSDAQLQQIAANAKKSAQQAQDRIDEEIKKKYFVN
ncbi:MAG: CCA tRNA nucleotidyltransferase [Candidatus Wildermuthbacteria bacterium]|nr:CCA tRNA nucleotidyltransferase [Candidatus Wildermuthbacteria bacterium]